ncbi:MAG: protocatechuate 3,4-dioxygenase beta subunit, partial [Planctomycetota bacterium]
DFVISQETFSSPNSQATISEDIRRVLQDFAIDTDRIYGFGFSIGGGAVTNYAARYLDPDPEKGMFAAVANHTGSVSTGHTYFKETNDDIDPPYDTPDFLNYLFGGDPNFVPFSYVQASTIDLGDVSGLVNPANSTAWNLRHIPMQVWYRTTDPLTYLVDQTLAFIDFTSGVVGASVLVRAVDVGPSSHTWFTMREQGVCDFFEGKVLTLPSVAKTLADRDATFFYFDVEQVTSGSMTPFTWLVDAGANSLQFSDVENMGRTSVDTLDSGLSPSLPYSIQLQSDDSMPFDIVMKDMGLAPYQVLLDGVPVQQDVCGGSGGWCFDFLESTVTFPGSLVPSDTSAHLWEVLPLPPDATSSTVIATPTSLIADGVTVSTVDITILDSGGSPLPGLSVNLQATGSGNAISQPADTDAAGMTTATISSSFAEVKTLTVTVDPLGLNLDLSTTPTVSFEADADQISASLSTVVATPTSGILANGVEETELTITVRDIYGNVIPSLDIGIVSTGISNSINQPGMTDAFGQATGRMSTTRAELKTMTVIVDPIGHAISLDDQPNVEFVADSSSISASLSTAAALPAFGVVADGLDASSLTVTVLDAFSNPVAGQIVELAVTGTDNTLQQPALVTDAAGQATGSLSSTRAETKVVTTTIEPLGANIVLTQTSSVEFVGDVTTIDANLSTLAVSPTYGALADGIDSVVIDARVRDQNDNPVEGQVVELSTSGSGGVLTQPGLSDAAGLAIGSMTSSRAELKTISAVVNPGPGEVALTATVQARFVWDLANTYYVRDTGSDAANGTSPATAWASLTHAAALLIAGDTLYVGAGTYIETPIFSTAGTLADPIRIIADTTGARTGDAGTVMLDGGGATSTLRIDGADFLRLRGFTIIGAAPGVGVAGGAVYVGGTVTTASVRLSELEVYGCGRGLHLLDAPSATVEDCRISNQTGGDAQGIVLGGTSTAKLRDMLVYNNGGEGIRVENGATGVSILACTLYANAGDQVIVDGAATVVTMLDCIVASGAADGIEVSGAATLTADFNDVFGHAGSDYVGLVAGLNDLSSDPLLEDPNGLDLLLGGADAADDRMQLDPLSPAVDAGSADANSQARTNELSLADRTTRLDQALDGEATDAATVNIGYHYPAPQDSLATLDQEDGRLVYAQTSKRATQARSFDDGAQTWSSSKTLPPTAPGLRWIETRASKLDGGEEFVLALGEDAGTTLLTLLEWDGVEWRRAWATTGVPSAQASQRGFDLAIADDGTVMAVYVDGSATPVYRTRQNGEWSSAASLPLNDAGGPNPDPNSASVSWIELSQEPGGDKVALAYVDVDDDLVSLLWDGSAWDTATVSTLELALTRATVSGEVDHRAFDLAWESTSGDLLVAWSQDASTGIWYSSLASGSTSWAAATQLTTIAPVAAPHFLDLTSDTSSNQIAISAATLEGVEALGLSVWDGTAMIDTLEIDAQARDWNGTSVGGFSSAVAWLGATGEIVCAYVDADAATLDWAHWSSGAGWILQADVAITAMGVAQDVRIEQLGSGDVMWIASDTTGALFAAVHDGVSWTLTSAGAALSTSLPSGGGVPFDAAGR